MRKILIASALILALFAPSSGDETDAIGLLKKAKKDMDEGRYAESIEGFTASSGKFPVIGDYILLWLSKAYREAGNIAESNAKIKELLQAYPESSLKKKARSMEIMNIMTSKETASGLNAVESYVSDYPEDREIKFLYGRLLKSAGRNENAKKVFRSLYVSGNGAVSKMAYGELSSSDITAEDLLEKGSNLIDAMEYKDAESILREALLKDDGQHRTDILRKLGHSLFRQKKYKEAAEFYGKAGDRFSRAKALYRVGEKAAFSAVLKELVSMKDMRAGSLMLWSAADKRRNNDIAGALRIYENIKANYPAEAENAMWGIGWVYYRCGEYQKAYALFSELHSVYGSAKYLYWKAQSLEKMGKDARAIYKQLASKEQDFYGVLAYIKNSQKSVTPGDPPEREVQSQKSEEAGTAAPQDTKLKQVDGESEGNQPLDASTPRPPDPLSPGTLEPSAYKPLQSDRVNILIELGMKKEAVSELVFLTRKMMRPEEVKYIAMKLKEGEEYKLAMSLISKLSNKEKLRDILYPDAYWSVVKDASERYGVDPFIILAVMREESRFDPAARSVAGAIGLMQLMPQTAQVLDRKVKINLTSREQIYDIKTNIALGSYYLNSLIKEFGSLPPAIAAYNAGEDVVRKWQKSGSYKSEDEFIEDIPYDETRNYTKRVITSYFEYIRSSGEIRIDKSLCPLTASCNTI